MPAAQLMPIGTFARRSGLTASALRFYADSGLIPPAVVEASGYRLYRADQLERAVLIRRLRAIGMPLAAVTTVLDAGPAEAARLVDEHVAGLASRARQAGRVAAGIKACWPAEPGLPVATVKGPVLAAAVEQVLTAAEPGPGFPVLGGVCAEATPESLRLTATDRYRLSTRTLVPDQLPAFAWAGTLDGDDLRAVVPELRRRHRVHVEAAPHRVRIWSAGQPDLHCRLLTEEYPDCRLLLSALPEPVTRVVVSRDALLRAVEAHDDDRVQVDASAGTLRLGPPGGRADVPAGGAAGVALAAAVTGPDAGLLFRVTTLHPAVSTAVGPDLMLDLRGSGQPVTIRSADDGDLTTLAMPVRPEGPPS